MRTPILVLTALFIYTAPMAQGTSYTKRTTEDPPAPTEAKKEQRFSKGELKGPRAKNYPTHRLGASPVVTTPTKKLSNRRMGPAAKNYRPGPDHEKTSRKLVVKKKRKDLKGPRAKNQKPWDHR